MSRFAIADYTPLGKAVSDVIEGGVDEDAGIVPSTRLDANRLVDEGMLREVLVRDRNGFRQGQFLHHPDIVEEKITVLAEKRNERAVRAPDDVLHRRGSDLGKSLLLLDVIQNDGRRRAEDQACSAAIEDLVRLDGGLDALDDRVRQVAHLDELFTPGHAIGIAHDGLRHAEERT